MAFAPCGRFVSQAARGPDSQDKSIAGDDIFACESGLHAHALSKSPALFEPYDLGPHRRRPAHRRGRQERARSRGQRPGRLQPALPGHSHPETCEHRTPAGMGTPAPPDPDGIRPADGTLPRLRKRQSSVTHHQTKEHPCSPLPPHTASSRQPADRKPIPAGRCFPAVPESACVLETPLGKLIPQHTTDDCAKRKSSPWSSTNRAG